MPVAGVAAAHAVSHDVRANDSTTNPKPDRHVHNRAVALPVASKRAGDNDLSDTVAHGSSHAAPFQCANHGDTDDRDANVTAHARADDAPHGVTK